MLTGLLILLLAVFALLAIPLTLEFKLDWPDVANNEVVLIWGPGLVRTRVDTSGPDKKAAVKTAPPDAKQRDEGKSTNVMAALRMRSFRQRIYRFFADLWRSVRKEDVRVHARIGLDDPADTGRLWAVVGPASGMAAGLKEVTVVIEPDFANEALQVDSQGRLQIVPLRIILVSLSLLWSPQIWRGLRAMRTS